MRTLSFVLAFLLSFESLSQILEDVIKQSESISNPNDQLDLLRTHENTVAFADDSMKAKYYYNLGIVFGKLYKTDSSNYYFQKALSSASRAENYALQIGALNGLGNVARISSSNKEAQAYFEDALEIAEAHQGPVFSHWQASLLGNIAGIFFDLKDYSTALTYSRKGLSISMAANDSAEIAQSLIRLGYCFHALNRLDSALKVNQEAALVLEKTRDSLGLIYQYYNMAGIYKARQDLEEATSYYHRLIAIAAKFGEVETHAASLNALAEIALQNAEYRQAENLISEALKLAINNGVLISQRTSHKLAYDLHHKQGDLAAAIVSLEAYHEVKDSIQRKDMLESIEEFRVKYEAAEKEKEVLAARQEIEENERFGIFLMIIIGIIVIFGAIAFVLIIQRYQLRRALLSQEIDNLRLQISTIFSGKIDALELTKEQLDDNLEKSLTSREYEILSHALSDKSNAEIADLTKVSVSTIKFHLKNAYQKLGVSSRKEALEFVINKND